MAATQAMAARAMTTPVDADRARPYRATHVRASIVAGWIWLSCAVAFAQPAQVPAPVAASAEPSAAQREAARQAYGRGQAHFAAGRYVDAKTAFVEAYSAVPNPVVLVSIAESEERLGLLEDAFATLQRYLSVRPDAPDRASVEKKIADLLAVPATLVISSQPSGAAIALDGVSTGKVTPAELTVSRGDHQLAFSLAGYQSVNEAIAARIGARHELVVALQPVPPPPPASASAPEQAPTPEVSRSSPTTALWITGIVGAAGLVTGSVLGFLTLSERSDFDAHPNEASADRGERLALFADVAFGVGAMALITGAVLYLTADDDATESAGAHRVQHTLRVSPAVTAEGAAVTARGHF